MPVVRIHLRPPGDTRLPRPLSRPLTTDGSSHRGRRVGGARAGDLLVVPARGAVGRPVEDQAVVRAGDRDDHEAAGGRYRRGAVVQPWTTAGMVRPVMRLAAASWNRGLWP